MKPATLFIATFLIWIAAKGRLMQYWNLATVSAASLPENASAAGGGGSHVSPLPALPQTNPLPGLNQ